MKLRIFGIANDSIVDGPGIRFAIFVQGCYHNCEGCHNPLSHDINGGEEREVDEILAEIKRNPLLDGVTFSGGEPFLHAKTLAYIAKQVKKLGLSTMAYTGYVYDELIKGANEENGWYDFLENIDILVDGRFVLEQRSVDLVFKGSKNQRIIDVDKSLKQGRVILSEYEK